MYRKTIVAASVSEALAKGLRMMTRKSVVHTKSRNGGVTAWDGPVTTHTLNPLRRVLFSAKRNANPFFHLFESLWMLAGSNDLRWVAQFNKQMKAYSDDGGHTQPAAYGYRWRGYFGYDQLETLIEHLRADPDSRRAVLAMWDGWGLHQIDGVNHFGDLQGVMQGSADVPCNTECYFTIRDGKLYMSVQCRSNDLLWGAHGANAVHFSILLEYVAAMVGVEVGEMFQYSWNYHLYDGVLKHPIEKMIKDLEKSDRYREDGLHRPDDVTETPIFSADTMDAFHADLPKFMEWAAPGDEAKLFVRFSHPFIKGTVEPMFAAWRQYKAGSTALALDTCATIAGEDWRVACTEWMQRRHVAKNKKES